MRVVVINGAPMAGKDTFVQCCQLLLGSNRVWNVSTVDFVKEVAKYCGWNGVKDPASRRFLSQLKDSLTEWDDVPFKKIAEIVTKFRYECSRLTQLGVGDGIIFIHCREPKEIQRLKETFNAVTVLVRRELVEKYEQSNGADSGVFDYKYDVTIDNNSDIPELHAKACSFLADLGLE